MNRIVNNNSIKDIAPLHSSLQRFSWKMYERKNNRALEGRKAQHHTQKLLHKQRRFVSLFFPLFISESPVTLIWNNKCVTYWENRMIAVVALTTNIIWTAVATAAAVATATAIKTVIIHSCIRKIISFWINECTQNQQTYYTIFCCCCCWLKSHSCNSMSLDERLRIKGKNHLTKIDAQ